MNEKRVALRRSEGQMTEMIPILTAFLVGGPKAHRDPANLHRPNGTGFSAAMAARLLASLGLCLVGLTLFLGMTQPAQGDDASASPLTASDFTPAAPQGLDGDRGNGWVWSMAWWNDHLYVGTNRDFFCLQVLAESRALLDLVPYPPDDPDISCPADPLALDLRAGIWRWSSRTGRWEQVYQSPTTVVTSFTRISGTIDPFDAFTETVIISETEVALDIGYRGMVVFEEPDGTEALYVTGVSAQFAGYPVPPPRILRSTDGVYFEPIPQEPGTVMGELSFTSLRNPVVHMGSDGVRRLYVQAGTSLGSGLVLESERPWEGNDSFREIHARDLTASAMGSFNGYLYVGIRDRVKGFSVIKMDADGGTVPYTYTTIIKRGGDAPLQEPNIEVLSLQVFDEHLYVGGSGLRLGPFSGDNTPAELFRIKPDDNWELVVGDVRILTPVGPRFPLSSYGPGFNNELNGHMWRMAVHDGYLYVVTFDSSTLSKDDDRISWGVLTEMGFDLYRTADGEHFEAVTTDGLSGQIDDPNPPRPDLNMGALDFGGRALVSTPYGLFLGTTNHYYGARIWRGDASGKVLLFDSAYVPIVLSGSLD